MKLIISLYTRNPCKSQRKKCLEFLENTVVPERTFLERWGAHRGESEGLRQRGDTNHFKGRIFF